jgi:hypothetical protein
MVKFQETLFLEIFPNQKQDQKLFEIRQKLSSNL